MPDENHLLSGQYDASNNRMSLSAEQSFDLLESISEVFYGLDSDWRFIYLNHKAEQLWGRKRDELIGKHIWQEFPQGVNTIAYKEMHRALEEQQTIRFETFSAFLEAWVEVEVYPMQTGLSVYFHNISQRKQAEVALEQSQQQLRLITDSLPVLISYIDADMQYQFVNKSFEEWFGLARDQCIGKPIAQVIGQTAFEATKPYLERVLQGETVQIQRDEANTTGIRFTHTQMLPHALEDGTVVGIVVMVDDITERKRTEEGLARLAAIVRSSNDAIISKTLDGIITSWNHGAESLFGYSVHEIIQKPITILIPSDLLDEEKLLLETIASGETVQNYDTIRLKKDGSPIFVSISLSPIIDEQGHISGASVIVQNITDRKREEAQLRQSESALKQAQHVAHVGSWIWHVKSNRLEWSDEMYRIFGIDKDNFSGDLGQVISRAIHPDDRAAVEKANSSVIKENLPVPLEYRVVWPDGTERVVWGEAGDMLLDPLGNSETLTGIVQDITERKRTEQSLRRSGERLAAINRLDHTIASNLDISQIYDNFVKELRSLIRIDRTAIVRLNEAGDQWQVSRQWTQHQPAILPGEWRPVRGSVIEWLVTNRVPFSEPEVGEHGNWPETVILQREGVRSRLLLPLIVQERVIGVLTVASRQPSAFSEEDHIILRTFADQLAIAIQNSELFEATQRHAAELEQRVIERTAQIEASNKELEAFSYSVSHDLRAPLRSIDGFSRILLRDYAAQIPAAAERYLHLVRDNTQQMGKLIDDLLAFSRLNRQPLTRQPVFLASMMHQVFEELMDGQDKRQIEIAISDLPLVQADPALLKQAIANLLSNALKFTQHRDVSRIEVDFQQTNGETVYAIRDNGAGFDMTYADKLFGVFQRLHRTEEFPGTGVGLAIVQRIIHRHGGRIWAYAEVDKGATFYFTLQGAV